MREYSTSDFTIMKTSVGWFACYMEGNTNWPFNLPKSTVEEHATQQVIDNNYVDCGFPFCKTQLDAQLALIKAVAYHNQLVNETINK